MPDRLLAAARPLARARLVTMARAGLVTMARSCGKKGCRCAQGQKHVSLYLAARVGKARKMLYVPRELEDAARALVENTRKVDALMEEMSQASLERFAQQKARRQRGPRS